MKLVNVCVKLEKMFVIISWNKNKCRRECKELIDKGVCDNGFIWNPSN